MTSSTKTEDVNWPGMIRLMTYGLAVSPQPPIVDDAFKSAIDQPDAYPASEYLAAIKAALASDRDLAEVMSFNYHNDQTVRKYLREVEERLLARLK